MSATRTASKPEWRHVMHHSESSIGKSDMSEGIFSNKNIIVKNNGSRKLMLKHINIQPFQVPLHPPESFVQQSQLKLRNAVESILTNHPLLHGKEELYRSVESLCLYNMEEDIFASLQEQCEIHVAEVVESLRNQNLDGMELLHRIVSIWKDLSSHIRTIQSIYLYLDRTFLLRSSEIRSIWDMGLFLLAHHFELPSNHVIISKAVHVVIDLIKSERDGETIDRATIATVLKMLHSLGMYKTEFDEVFINSTISYFQLEGASLLQQYSTSQYLNHVSTRIEEETERKSSYLVDTSLKTLLSVVESELLKTHCTTILETGFDDLLSSRAIAELKLLYHLYGRISCHDLVKSSLSLFISKFGSNIVLVPEKDSEMVERLLELKECVDIVLKESFGGNPEFIHSVKESFERFINQRKSAPAEYMAKYADQLLRLGKRQHSDEEIDHLLNNLMVLFRYINGKDVFEAFYKKDLAKRLLLHQSASIEFERSMVKKLRKECGNSFTNKLEGMFTDMTVSEELNDNFKTHISQLQDFNTPIMDFDLNILTMGYWPSYPTVVVYMHPSVQDYLNAFSDYYLNLSKHNGRKLAWANSLAYGELKATFPSGVKLFEVSAFQAAILFQFNDQATISFQKLCTSTLIEKPQLILNLQSLLSAKVLQKKSKSKDIEETDQFRINRKFSSKHMKVRINAVQMEETVQERSETNERVDQDRQHQIDATLVRIMKSKKTLSHSVLISEAVTQLKFPATISDLKKRIASLIERDYIERDPDNSQVYNYVA